VRSKKWESNEKAEFLQRLATLLKQGYTLAAGIGLLRYHQKPQVRDDMDELLEKLKQGEPFHEILDGLDFPKDVLGYLYFSEQHGDLAFALEQGGKMMEKRIDFKIRFQKLIRYPVFLLWVICVLVFFMFRYLFPQFQSLYDSLDIDFPGITVIFLRFVELTPFILGFVLLMLLLIYVYYRTRFRHYHPHRQLSSLLRVPLVRPFLPVLLSQYFAVQLSCLIKGGMSIYEALTIFEKQHHLSFFQQEAQQMKIMLQRGETLEGILDGSPFYVKELSHVVAHGQSNGQLPQELFYYSDLLFDLMEEKVKRLFMIAQPVIFAGIGTLVLLMFASILLPVFSLMNSL
jgi:competence protein ComGB